MRRANLTGLPDEVSALLKEQVPILRAMGRTRDEIEHELQKQGNDWRRNNGKREVKMR